MEHWIFEVPDTAKSRAFMARNPWFPGTIDSLAAVAEKCIAREVHLHDPRESICFRLGETCLQDFFEIAFLAIEGYGTGAIKILRSLYERAVTIEYLIQNPNKIDRFRKFSAIQEHRMLEAAIKIAHLPEDQIEAKLRNRIREEYEKYKGTFKAIECEVCGARIPLSWDIDLSSMVQRVGEPYTQLFFFANTLANFQIHATLALYEPLDEAKQESNARTALTTAIALLLAVMRSQNTLFSLNLDAEIDACTNDIRDAGLRLY